MRRGERSEANSSISPLSTPLGLYGFGHLAHRKEYEIGPIAIAVYAVTLSLPVWAAWWWLERRG